MNMKTPFAIGARMLVSLPQNSDTSGHSSLYPKTVFDAVELRVLEYSKCKAWVKVELAETRECVWWKVSDFPDHLADLDGSGDEDEVSPLQQYLQAKRERAFAEYAFSQPGQTRQVVIAVVEMPVTSFNSNDVFIVSGQLMLSPDAQTKGEQAFIEVCQQKGIQEMKIAGLYAQISP